jgi:hypothetical protein
MMSIFPAKILLATDGSADAELPPVAPSAVVATPKRSASATARPTIKTVALPTHITFENALLAI